MLVIVCYCVFILHLFFFILRFFLFKQKTAYEMRISDWSSDVCSSDLAQVNSVQAPELRLAGSLAPALRARLNGMPGMQRTRHLGWLDQAQQIGRASCRERVCQYV